MLFNSTNNSLFPTYHLCILIASFLLIVWDLLLDYTKRRKEETSVSNQTRAKWCKLIRIY